MSKQKLEFIRTTKLVNFPLKNYLTPRIRIPEDSERRHQKRLSVAEKLEILKKLDSGRISMTELAEIHGVSRAAIYKIKYNRENILKYANNISNLTTGDKKRTSAGFPIYEMLDEILFAWICQRRQQGLPFNGPYICDVALEVNRIIGGTDHFKASQGWLSSFKTRRGMKRSRVQGEKLSIDTSKFQEFHVDYIKINKDQDYKVENIYIGDEASLNWKSMPLGTDVISGEKRVTKDKVCILFCANADGSSRLPPLVIGPSRKPRTVRGKNVYPVTYAAQKSSWMEQRIFTDWYKNHFIPFVKNKQKTRDPVLLIIDDCPVHPSVDELNKIDPQFRVVNTFSKVIPVTDFMHRLVIQKAKMMYRKKFLLELATALRRSSDVQKFLNGFETIDACYMMAAAWQQIPQPDLAVTWSKLKRSYELATTDEENSFEEFSLEYESIEELKQLFKNIPACQNCSDEDIKNWLKEDFFDQGWEPLNLQKVVQRVLTAHNLVIFHDPCEDPLDNKIIAKMKREVNSREKSEDSDTPVDVDYTDFAILDDTFDSPESDQPKSETLHERCQVWLREPTPDSTMMEYSNNKTQESEAEDSKSSARKSTNSGVKNFIKNEKEESMPAPIMNLDEEALNAVTTLQRWYKINTNSNENIVRKHLEALANVENYITAFMVSNYSNSSH